MAGWTLESTEGKCSYSAPKLLHIHHGKRIFISYIFSSAAPPGAGLFHWVELSKGSPWAMLPAECPRTAQAKGGSETLVTQRCL